MDTETILAAVQGFVLVVQVALAVYLAWQSRRKISAEGKKIESEYWQSVATDLREEMKASNDRIATLEERDRIKGARIERLTDAFEFLCEAVNKTNPKAVRMARKIESGIVGGDDDITEAHE